MGGGGGCDRCWPAGGLSAPHLPHPLHERLEAVGLVHGQLGEGLAVERNVILLQPVHEIGVLHPVSPRACVDALDPQPADVPLESLAVPVLVLESLLHPKPSRYQAAPRPDITLIVMIQ